jgi:hypothetical protein
METVSEGGTTYGNQIKSLHDQARGQEHCPEHGHLVLLQRLLDGKHPIGGIALLRMADQVVRLSDTKIKTLELLLGRYNSSRRHSSFHTLEVESCECMSNTRAAGVKAILM